VKRKNTAKRRDKGKGVSVILYSPAQHKWENDGILIYV
jgi:hypothetical protein